MRVIYVDIDTLRPDHMGCYGYNRDTTPAIDKVAEAGTVFTNYYCSDAPCLPSRAALISGMFGIHNGAVGHGGTAADMRLYGEERGFKNPCDMNNFVNIFRKAGMKTASVSTFPERHSSYWFNAGFHETYNVGGSGNESGELVLPEALGWLDRNMHDENWFLHVHFWDPHTPYRAPAAFGNPFADTPLDTWITPEIFAEHLQHPGPHGANEINMFNDDTDPRYPRHPGKISDMEGLRGLFDGYDCGIRYADSLVGQIFDKLRENGIYEDTAIIISSDHGENMGEWGIYAEHATADHATCNIPMIIKWPGGMKGHVDKELHYNVDLAPTVAELLQVPAAKNWDGASYAQTIQTGDTAGRESLVISQCAHVCQRSARFGDWIYVRTYHDGFHLFDDEMLYNIKEDRHEQLDVKDKYPEVCMQGAKIILDWHDAMMMTSRYAVDPLWTVMREGGPSHARGELEAFLVRLEATGRAEGARRLREKYAAQEAEAVSIND